MTTHIDSVQLARYIMETLDLEPRRKVVLHLKNCDECMAKAQEMFHNIAATQNTAQYNSYCNLPENNIIKNKLKNHIKSGALGTMACNFVQAASEGNSIKRNILRVNNIPAFEISFNPPFNANDPSILTIEILDQSITEGTLFIDDLAEFHECIEIYDRKMVLLIEQKLEFYDITIQYYGTR